MNSVLLRFASMLVLAGSFAQACDCLAPTAFAARKSAGIIFRGKIMGFRDTGRGTPMVVFAVDRVWKGNVPQTFEMPAVKETTGCFGFWPTFLEIGKNLLVYAYQINGKGDYFTTICSRTALIEDTRDVFSLGFGHAPGSQ